MYGSYDSHGWYGTSAATVVVGGTRFSVVTVSTRALLITIYIVATKVTELQRLPYLS